MAIEKVAAWQDSLAELAKSPGFITTPLTVGLIPIQRFLPALPIDIFSFSILLTCPMEALHNMLTILTSPEGSLTCAYLPSFAINWAELPAERTNCPPPPGFSSILYIMVPTGIFSSGSALPGRMSAWDSQTRCSMLQGTVP